MTTLPRDAARVQPDAEGYALAQGDDFARGFYAAELDARHADESPQSALSNAMRVLRYAEDFDAPDIARARGQMFFALMVIS